MSDEEKCLHCDIVQLVEEHMQEQIEAGQQVNAADIADRMSEALADFILSAVPTEERAKMIAYAIEHLGRALQTDEDSGTRH